MSPLAAALAASAGIAVAAVADLSTCVRFLGKGIGTGTEIFAKPPITVSSG